MKIFKATLAALVSAAALVSCTEKLTLPDDWKEQNVKNIENTDFTSHIKNIDPAQNWNVASMNPAQWITNVSISKLPATEQAPTTRGGGNTGGNTGGGSNTSTDKSETTTIADYFKVQQGDSIIVNFTPGSAWATITFGIYYYNASGDITYVPIVEDFHGRNYNATSGQDKTQYEADKAKVGQYVIKLEQGQYFGLYIQSHLGPDVDSYYKNTYDFTFYSQKSLNEDGIGHVQLATVTKTTTTTTTTGSGRNQKTTTEKTTETYQEIRFEDSAEGNEYCDLDYNDWVLTVVTPEGSNKTIEIFEEDDPYDYKEDPYIVPVDQDGGPWLILCEDLGSNNDNDFNDVIFRVSRFDDEEVTVDYVAGGSTRENNILFNNTVLGEIHKVFGVNINWDNDYSVAGVGDRPDWFINTKVYNGIPSTSETTWSPIVEGSTVACDASLSMSTFYRSDANDCTQGFSVKSSTMNEVPFSPNYEGYAPYIICVPAEGFRWPQENVSIWDAYPEFEGWAQDHTQNTDWYLHPDEDKVVDLDACLKYLGIE